MQEKAREHYKDLFVAFANLTKTLDTVSRDALWVVPRKLNVSERRLNVIKSFRQEMDDGLRSSREMLNPFIVSNRTKQDCVLKKNLPLSVMTMGVRDSFSYYYLTV